MANCLPLHKLNAIFTYYGDFHIKNVWQPYGVNLPIQIYEIETFIAIKEVFYSKHKPYRGFPIKIFQHFPSAILQVASITLINIAKLIGWKTFFSPMITRLGYKSRDPICGCIRYSPIKRFKFLRVVLQIRNFKLSECKSLPIF